MKQILITLTCFLFIISNNTPSGAGNIIYNNIIILENDDYALVMPKYSHDGFINYYN